MMNKLTLPLLLGLLSGCASSVTPHYDEKFGLAVRTATRQQTLHPDAGKTPEAVNGIDGKAAQEAQLRYQGTFQAPPPVVNVINIGGGLGGK
jgi:uncharacterized protein YceK